MNTIHIVAGGQYGSEGKGAFTAALTKRLTDSDSDPVLIRVAGPNAGHTAYDAEGREWALRQIPVGAVVNQDSLIVIGQQSEIDLGVLIDEIDRLEEAGIPILRRLTVDQNATVIEERHAEQEQDISTGSTKKGIGAARADRLLRKAKRFCDVNVPGSHLEDLGIAMGDTARILVGMLRRRDLIIEGTQGYGLGSHTEYYPYTTSSNCRPGDFLAMTGIQPWEAGEIVPWLVFRSHPIRIAGSSGPMYLEVDWDTIEQPVEYTTVTQLPRRVGLWDAELAASALASAGAFSGMVLVAYNFIDYVWPKLHGQTEWDQVLGYRVELLEKGLGHQINYVGTGPQTGVWRPRTGEWNGDR